MAHVLNLGAQQILKEFKQPFDKDTYEAGSDSSDNMVTASPYFILVQKNQTGTKIKKVNGKDLQSKRGYLFSSYY